jgi:hypothetical protein
MIRQKEVTNFLLLILADNPLLETFMYIFNLHSFGGDHVLYWAYVIYNVVSNKLQCTSLISCNLL